MATIQTNRDLTVLKIKEFLGLNENPDGDTGLKNGEMAEMRNFRITRDKHLQIRPGQKTILSVREAWDAWVSGKSDTPKNPRFCGAWNGLAGGYERTLIAFGGAVFSVSTLTESVKVVGACTQDDTTFFGFGDKVYLLNGHEYLSWNGDDNTQFAEVVGYIPTVITASTPAGAGTALENVNRLSGKRKAKFSPDGTSKDFMLPEKSVDEIVAVEGTNNTYTLSQAEGKVTFNEAPAAGVNTITITYRKGNGEPDQVRKMRFAELFNGATDSRVFLYGDGTNKTIYSGTNIETGQPSAEYFPDLYEAAIGDENTPITAMIRHHSRLMVFKTNSAWSMDYNVVTTAIGTITAALYVTPVNRQFGNEAPGQVQLLENDPLTLDSDAVYQWKATTSSGNITSDNRNASRVSDRVKSTFSEFDLAKVKTFNRRYENEYWFLYNGKACIMNYGNNTWYLYTNMPFMQMLEINGKVYGFREDGGVVHVSRQYRNDDGKEIDAYAETGNMDFDRDWLVKYSPMIFVAIKPESNARVTVTVETNRRSDYPEKIVSAGLTSFVNVDFNHFSFGTNRKPQVRRLKIKVKKATFYKLVFKSLSASATATVLETDIQLRYTGKVK